MGEVDWLDQFLFQSSTWIVVTFQEGDKSVTRSFSESASIDSGRHLSMSNSDIIEDDLDDAKAEEIKKETKEYVPDTQEEDRNDGQHFLSLFFIYKILISLSLW